MTAFTDFKVSWFVENNKSVEHTLLYRNMNTNTQPSEFLKDCIAAAVMVAFLFLPFAMSGKWRIFASAFLNKK